MSRSAVSAISRRRAVLQFGALLSLPVLSSQAMAQATLTVKQASGDVQVPIQPATILVYDLAAMDCLRALGAKISGVPEVVKLPPVLQAFASKDYPRIGSLFEPDYEAVQALKPDVIIVGGRSVSKIKELGKIAPTLDLTVDNLNSVDSAFKHLRLLGKMVAQEAKAETLIKGMETDIAKLKTVTSGKGNALTVMANGGKLSAYGPGSRFGMIHDVYGIPAANKNIQVSGHGQAISFEFILKTNPDWLFVLDRDGAIGREGASATKLLDNPLVKATKAAKKGQIVYLNSMNWYLLGNASPGSLHEDLAQLYQLFSKAAKA